MRHLSEIRGMHEDHRRCAYKAWLKADHRRADTLRNRIDAGVSLTESEQDAIWKLLSKRCRARTKAYLAFSLRCVPDVPSYGIYDRVELIHNQHPTLGITAVYNAGQSYPDEIRTVRECLIGR